MTYTHAAIIALVLNTVAQLVAIVQREMNRRATLRAHKHGRHKHRAEKPYK